MDTKPKSSRDSGCALRRDRVQWIKYHTTLTVRGSGPADRKDKAITGHASVPVNAECDAWEKGSNVADRSRKDRLVSARDGTLLGAQNRSILDRRAIQQWY